MHRFYSFGKIVIAVFVVVAALTGITWKFAPMLMFTEHVSPFGFDETVARIEHNILGTPGWTLSGLRNPASAIKGDKRGSVMPVVMIETCNTEYSKPILDDNDHRFLAILMPCKIAVARKSSDNTTYVYTMNAKVMGWMFGPKIGEIMSRVAEDQKKFLVFDPNTPTPELLTHEEIVSKKTASSSGTSSQGGGC